MYALLPTCTIRHRLGCGFICLSLIDCALVMNCSSEMQIFGFITARQVRYPSHYGAIFKLGGWTGICALSVSSRMKRPPHSLQKLFYITSKQVVLLTGLNPQSLRQSDAMLLCLITVTANEFTVGSPPCLPRSLPSFFLIRTLDEVGVKSEALPV